MRKSVLKSRPGSPTSAPKTPDEAPPEYEPVIVRASASKNTSAIAKRPRSPRPRPKLEPDEVLLTRKWISLLTLTGFLMLIVGSICGVGVYMLMKKNVPKQVPSSRAATISGQCVDYLKNEKSNGQYCVFEKPASNEDDTCRSLCNVLEWWIEVDEQNDNMVSFHQAPEDISSVLDKFVVRRGTKCGANFTCSKNGTCSGPARPPPKGQTPSVLPQFQNAGQWINTCPDGLEQCVRFPDTKADNITFKKQTSEAAWKKMVDKAGCSEQQKNNASSDHCEQFKGVVHLVPRFQFRRCMVSSSSSKSRSLKCDGLPMVVYSCSRCAAAVDPDKIFTFIEDECDSNRTVDRLGQPPSSCVIQCAGSSKRLVMPDGYACDASPSAYCLMGHCYSVTDGIFSNCTSK